MNAGLACFVVSLLLCLQIVKGEATQNRNESLSDKIVIQIESTSIPSPQNTFTPRPGNPHVNSGTPLPWPHPASMNTFSPAPQGSENQSSNGLNALEISSIKPIGCYRDSYVEPRPLPELIADFRDSIGRNNDNKTIQACAETAKKRGFKFFGVQFYTECWSGPEAEKTYARDGISKDCINGVGKSGANFVYAFGGDEKLPCPVCEQPRHLCFPAISRLTLESGASISMRQLRVGDRVRTLGTKGETTYSEVIAFLHKETETQVQYYRLEISGGNTILLSPQHLIFRKQNSSSSVSVIFASEIEPGDLVSNGSDSFDETVIRVTMATEKGVYAPLTLEGTMIVDGVLVSCYASWHSHDAAHLSMAPLRAWRWFSNLMPWRLLESGPNREGISSYALILMTLTGIFN